MCNVIMWNNNNSNINNDNDINVCINVLLMILMCVMIKWNNDINDNIINIIERNDNDNEIM